MENEVSGVLGGAVLTGKQDFRKTSFRSTAWIFSKHQQTEAGGCREFNDNQARNPVSPNLQIHFVSFSLCLFFQDRVSLCGLWLSIHTSQTRLAGNSQRYTCLCLPSAGTKGLCLHHLLNTFLSRDDLFHLFKKILFKPHLRRITNIVFSLCTPLTMY